MRDLRAVSPGRAHAYLTADLSLLGETARLGDDVAARTGRVDSVVLCAGVFAGAAEWTDEGMERTFSLNYLSRFLLVDRLLPLMLPAGRVVLVANAGRYRDTLDLEAIRLGRAHPRRHLASASQFANDLFAVELGQRLHGSGVEVSCVFPGVVRTDVFRNARGVPRALRRVALGVQRIVGADAEVAAETPAVLAQDPAAAGMNGGFFGPGLRPIRVPDRALDPERRDALWRASAELVAPWTIRPTVETDR